MMGRSEAYAGIKRDLLLIAAAIPPGRVTTFGAIGAYMSVVPRHIAYILATLSEEEQLSLPWHRIVGDGGRLGRPRRDVAGRTQEELLLAEGVELARGAVAAFGDRFIEVADLATGVEPHRLYRAEAARRGRGPG